MKRGLFLHACVALALLSGCAPAPQAAQAPVDEAHRRIISLIPSLTEDLFAIGAGSQVVGVSMFTTYPAQARSLPVIASSNAINTERIVTLHPDLIVGISSQANILRTVQKLDIPAVTFRDDTYQDIFTSLQGLGVLSGHIEGAQLLVHTLRGRTEALQRSIHFRRKPRALVVLGIAPIYTVGDRSFIATLIRMAGGVNAAHLKEAYAQYSPEAVVAAQPDIIITDATSGLLGVLGSPPWNALRAVRDHHVYIAPLYLSIPGPRYNDGLAWLIERMRAVQ